MYRLHREDALQNFQSSSHGAMDVLKHDSAAFLPRPHRSSKSSLAASIVKPSNLLLSTRRTTCRISHFFLQPPALWCRDYCASANAACKLQYRETPRARFGRLPVLRRSSHRPMSARVPRRMLQVPNSTAPLTHPARPRIHPPDSDTAGRHSLPETPSTI